jgi:hypothetical protein
MISGIIKKYITEKYRSEIYWTYTRPKSRVKLHNLKAQSIWGIVRLEGVNVFGSRKSISNDPCRERKT